MRCVIDGKNEKINEGGCPLFKNVLSYSLFLYLFGYGVVLMVSLINPEGFLMIIEIFGSLALNLECGCFVAIMAYESNSNVKYSMRYIPLSLNVSFRKYLIR